MELSSKFKLSEKIILEDIGNESVLLDLKSGIFFKLNATAKKIVALIKDHKNLDEISKSFFKEGNNSTTRDIILFLDDLAQRGFIEIINKDN